MGVRKADDAIIAGMLYKQDRNGAWGERFFFLFNDEIAYHSSARKALSEDRRSFPVKSVTSMSQAKGSKGGTVIVLNVDGQSHPLRIRASKESDIVLWHQALDRTLPCGRLMARSDHLLRLVEKLPTTATTTSPTGSMAEEGRRTESRSAHTSDSDLDRSTNATPTQGGSVGPSPTPFNPSETPADRMRRARSTSTAALTQSQRSQSTGSMSRSTSQNALSPWRDEPSVTPPLGSQMGSTRLNLSNTSMDDTIRGNSTHAPSRRPLSVTITNPTSSVSGPRGQGQAPVVISARTTPLASPRSGHESYTPPHSGSTPQPGFPMRSPNQRSTSSNSLSSMQRGASMSSMDSITAAALAAQQQQYQLQQAAFLQQQLHQQQQQQQMQQAVFLQQQNSFNSMPSLAGHPGRGLPHSLSSNNLSERAGNIRKNTKFDASCQFIISSLRGLDALMGDLAELRAVVTEVSQLSNDLRPEVLERLASASSSGIQAIVTAGVALKESFNVFSAAILDLLNHTNALLSAASVAQSRFPDSPDPLTLIASDLDASTARDQLLYVSTLVAERTTMLRQAFISAAP